MTFARSDLQLHEVPTALRELAFVVSEAAAASQAACAYLKSAEMVERALRGSLMEPLRPEEAEVEGGYTTKHLRRLLKNGTLKNAGTSEKPLILRGHVPRKPGFQPEYMVEIVGKDKPGSDPPRVAASLGEAASYRVQAARAVAEGE